MDVIDMKKPWLQQRSSRSAQENVESLVIPDAKPFAEYVPPVGYDCNPESEAANTSTAVKDTCQLRPGTCTNTIMESPAEQTTYPRAKRQHLGEDGWTGQRKAKP
eukprot:765541-Hanusia_phi.AAC.1